MAASATFALKVGVWFRRGRLFMVSPDSLGTACPLSGRNSTYRPVQISETSSLHPLESAAFPRRTPNEDYAIKRMQWETGMPRLPTVRPLLQRPQTVPTVPDRHSAGLRRRSCRRAWRGAMPRERAAGCAAINCARASNRAAHAALECGVMSNACPLPIIQREQPCAHDNSPVPNRSTRENQCLLIRYG